MDMRKIGSQAIYKRRNTSGAKENVRKNKHKSNRENKEINKLEKTKLGRQKQ